MNLILSSIINDDNHQQDKSIFYENHCEDITYYICDQCSKIFVSKYGLTYHINMYHPNQSIFCSNCNLTFRSHRALKNHQQRFHFISSDKLHPNYNYISSYFVLAFSTQQFTLIAKNACEQGRFPLGELSLKFFQCQFCSLSFPCSNALKYHLLNKHEEYEYDLCKNILYDIILQVEQNLRTVNDDDDDDIQSMKYLLAKQASHFGLVDKQLQRESRSKKSEYNHLIFPSCQHSNRTCANLCLNYLSSYNKLIENYPYKISILPKGNPFAQGSIVSNVSSVNTSENLNINQKSLKRVRSSPQLKRKLFSTIDQQFKTNETDLISPKKSFPKVNHSYTRSLSSMSSNSSTSTRSSSKHSRHKTIASLKRSISPTITLAVERSSEKRRQQREQRKAKALSSTTIKISDDIEQENDDDDDIISIKSKKPKQRQASNSSVEYVQIINNDQQSISSLNNIENYDEDIIVCHSSPKKTPVNGIHKINNHQTSDYDENIRVRCKICGDILEGRSRFSKHVLTMHSHLLKNNISDIKQQQQTTMVYSV